MKGWVIAAVVLFAARDASAYCRTTTCDPNKDGEKCEKNEQGCIRDGVPLRWKSQPIVYRFHSGGSSKLDPVAAKQAIRRAFEEWENVQCTRGRTSLRFEEGPEIEDDKPLDGSPAPDKFGIYFRDDEWAHENSDESLALTNQTYGKTTGYIEYADIEINTAFNDFRVTDDEGPNKIDLQAVITHEVGHYIGLAHSPDPESIMVARYCQSEDRCGQGVDASRGLSRDDRNAVCAVYGPKDDAGDSVPDSAGCSQSGRSSQFATGGLLFLAVAIARRVVTGRGAARRRAPGR